MVSPNDPPHADAGMDGLDICGIVMPISAIDNCTESHWSEVLAIVSDAITDAGLRPNLVSNADDVGIIQKRIIQNLYTNEIVVCDVSGKNPNVMFELGMRLAFDKPTIIIKDDKTEYSFDTSPIEHLNYPRDLRFGQIIAFKRDLREKIKGTINKSRSDSNYTTFLKNFGEFKIVEIAKTEISQQEFLSEEISDIRRYLRNIDNRVRRGVGSDSRTARRPGICLEGFEDEEVRAIESLVLTHPKVVSTSVDKVGDHFHVYPVYSVSNDSTTDTVRREIMNANSDYRATRKQG